MKALSRQKLVASTLALTLASFTLAGTRIQTHFGFGEVTFEPRAGIRALSGFLMVRPNAPIYASKGNVNLPKSLTGLQIVKSVPATNEFRIRVPKGSTEVEVGEKLMATGEYLYVTPDWIVYPCSTPNDPDLSQQWYHNQISSSRAWDFSSGSGVTIAITDGGIRLTHEDLASHLVEGYNSVVGLPQHDGGDVTDVQSAGHGTRCAGIAGAIGNNGLGIAGVAYNSYIMPIRVTNQTSGSALLSDLTNGVRWAAEHGAKVVSTSYTNVSDPSVGATGDYIQGLGALSVWAADNSNIDQNTFDWDSVVVVGSTDANDSKASFSSYGIGVDIYAPGVSIRTTFKTSDSAYGNVQGTSFSTPMVAGVAALIYARNPGIGAVDVQRKLYRYARDLGLEQPVLSSTYRPGNDDYWGWGRLNSGSSTEAKTMKYDFFQLQPLTGYLQCIALGSNDLGDNVGYSYNTDPNLTVPCMWPAGYATPISLGLPPLPGGAATSWVSADKISNTGTIVVNAGYGSDGGSIAFIWRPSSGYTMLHKSTIYSNATAINNHDEVVGTSSETTSYTTYWTAADILANSHHTIPDTGFGLRNYGRGVNDRGQILWMGVNPGSSALSLGYYDPIFDTNSLIASGGGNNAYYGYDLTDSGYVMGSLLVTSFNESHWRLFNLRNGARGYSRDQFGWFSAANESDLFLAFRNAGGRGPIIYSDGVWKELTSVAALNTILTSPVSPTITAPEFPYAVNEIGEITMSLFGTSPSGYKAAILKPNPNFVANYNFGQIGASPTYHGILPSLMQVDLRNTAGVSVASSIAARYDANTGKLRFQIPQALDQPFRVYLRLPKYLGKIYPPLSEPALPPDATWIPMQDVVQGDQNSDNVIDLTDYTIIVSYFNWDSGLGGWDDPDSSGFAPHDGDVNEDGIVDLSDYTIVVSNFNMIGD